MGFEAAISDAPAITLPPAADIRAQIEPTPPVKGKNWGAQRADSRQPLSREHAGSALAAEPGGSGGAQPRSEHGDVGAARSAGGGEAATAPPGGAGSAGLVIYAKTARGNCISRAPRVTDSPNLAFDLGFRFPTAADVGDAGRAVAALLSGAPWAERSALEGSGKVGYDRRSGAAAVVDDLIRLDTSDRSPLGRFFGDEVREALDRPAAEGLTCSLRIASGAVSLAVVSPDREAQCRERAAKAAAGDARSADNLAALVRRFIRGADQLPGVQRSRLPALTVAEGESLDEAVGAWWAARDDDTRQVLMRAAASAVGAVHLAERGAPTREVTEWSRKSRAAMVRAFAEIDYTPIIEAPGTPVMVTVTYPRCWLRVAPTGRAVKAHVKALRARFERRYGQQMAALWKVEFQGRRESARCSCAACDGFDDGRAPHVHLWLARPVSRVVDEPGLVPMAGRASTRIDAVPAGWRVRWTELDAETGRVRRRSRTMPTLEVAEQFVAGARVPDWVPTTVVETPAGFAGWLSESWADVVDHPDPEQRALHALAGTAVDVREGLRASDPRRLAVYFSKHGATNGQVSGKEYQHSVPEAWRSPGDGPGRFWGYWGLSRVASSVTLSLDDFVQARRCLRRWSRHRVVIPAGHRWPTAVYPDTVTVRVERGHRADGSPRYRRSTRRRALLGSGAMVGGFVCTTDGARLGVAVGQALRPRPPSPPASRWW